MKLEPANIVCPACGSGNYMRHLIGKNVGYMDMKCINCNSYFNFDELYKRRIGEVLEPKPVTNYDRLVRKSPEELSEFLAERATAPSCTGKCHKDYEIYGEQRTFCHDCWLEYLKREVKE